MRRENGFSHPSVFTMLQISAISNQILSAMVDDLHANLYVRGCGIVTLTGPSPNRTVT
jgi:hypothetical protein